MRELIKYTIMYISLVFVQVLILNQVQFSGFVNPYIYLLFILLLPVNIPRYLLLFLSFFLGLTIDVFSNTLGIHAAASVLAGYVRPFVITGISSREEDRNEYPGLSQNKFRWFAYYVSIMVFIHHFCLFLLEVFSFSHFHLTFARVVISSVFTVGVIILSQFIVFRK